MPLTPRSLLDGNGTSATAHPTAAAKWGFEMPQPELDELEQSITERVARFDRKCRVQYFAQGVLENDSQLAAEHHCIVLCIRVLRSNGRRAGPRRYSRADR